MDSTIAAGLIGAGSAIAGAAIATTAALVAERHRATASALEAHNQELRTVCSEFTAAIARVRSNSYHLNEHPAAGPSVVAAMEEARVGCERLRLLVSDRRTQRAARLALRHAYAVWKLAETGVDRRADEFENKPPAQRLREELTLLYIGVRSQLGVENPADVFDDLED